ncbi:hypothetical protein [Vibrio sp. D431a]|uniref:hypothetical protein n=1 Tax=Vibrio sp. D431a TaxID=2837388 RepID=UPI0025568DB7|nr:hypothetical protein [Vibrio sp. D431a]MDK9789961.1 hypothetical protein [Vibrio sp. D431a]
MAKKRKREREAKKENLLQQLRDNSSPSTAMNSQKVEVRVLGLAEAFCRKELQRDPEALEDVKTLFKALGNSYSTRDGILDKEGNKIELGNYLNAGGGRKQKIQQLSIDKRNKPIRFLVTRDSNKLIVAHGIFKKNDGNDYKRECTKASDKVKDYNRNGDHSTFDEVMKILGEDKPSSPNSRMRLR